MEDQVQVQASKQSGLSAWQFGKIAGLRNWLQDIDETLDACCADPQAVLIMAESLHRIAKELHKIATEAGAYGPY